MKHGAHLILSVLALLSAIPSGVAQTALGERSVLPAGLPLADGRRLAADLVITQDMDEVQARFTDGTSEKLDVLHCTKPGLRGSMPLLFKKSQPHACPDWLTPLRR